MALNDMLSYQAFRPKEYAPPPNMFLESCWDLDTMWRQLKQTQLATDPESVPNPYPSVLGFRRMANNQELEDYSDSLRRERRFLPAISTILQERENSMEAYADYEMPNRLENELPIEEKYNKQYAEMMNNVAHRYPNPGKRRTREGNIGGSWRNVNEVLSYGGNRIVYIDGKTRIYDTSGLNEAIVEDAHRSASARARARTPLYVPNHRDLTAPGYCTQRRVKYPGRDACEYSSYGRSFNSAAPDSRQHLPPIDVDYMNRVQHHLMSKSSSQDEQQQTIKGFYKYP